MPARANGESHELAGGRRPGLFHAIDGRAGRALAELGQEPLQVLGRALGDAAHGAIGLVGDPAHHAKALGCADYVESKSDALDAAARHCLQPLLGAHRLGAAAARRED